MKHHWQHRQMLCLILLLLLASIRLDSAAAQRFLRSSDSMENDFRGEMKLDESQALSGMTREMFLMQDISWELQPPTLDATKLDRQTRAHILKYLNSPLQLSLSKRQGKYGLRAVGTTDKGKRLRAFWRQAPTDRLKASDFLDVSYDQAVRSRLFAVEFEVQLPPIPGSKKKKQLPSVVYQIPVEPGGMNPKSMVARGAGVVRVYPQGKDDSTTTTKTVVVVDNAGTCQAGVYMKAGLVDPTWAKGRPVFRKGRSLGLL